ncbi:hypothetical protein F2P81_007671 [Scophthalmus maximus]|uniref:Uncharacterized protein n=1 Tax=Scophthalmus maximus TaxID=52904 RepID=A0A6A4SW14_SCOMX|nr:hypothetical protein F2P81_007671 [Scophthalmus maximus]
MLGRIGLNCPRLVELVACANGLEPLDEEQKLDGHRTRGVRGDLQRLCGVCEDVWAQADSAVNHGGGADPRQKLRHGADPQRSVQAPGTHVVP